VAALLWTTLIFLTTKTPHRRLRSVLTNAIAAIPRKRICSRRALIHPRGLRALPIFCSLPVQSERMQHCTRLRQITAQGVQSFPIV
jgi:hypothetical protein